MTDNERRYLDKIIKHTCSYFKITKDEFLSDSRKAKLVKARRTYGLLAADYVPIKKEIANYINRHSSTFYNWDNEEGDPDVQRAIWEVRANVDVALNATENVTRYLDLIERKSKLVDELHHINENISMMKDSLNIEQILKDIL